MARGGRRKKKKPSERELRDLETYGALKSLLEEQGWRVNLASTLDGRGGHCIVRGEQRVILKSQLATSDKIDVLVEALRGLDLEDVHLRPDLRELLEPGSLGASDGEPVPDPAPERAEEPVQEPAAGS